MLLSETQSSIRATVREFVRRHVRPHARKHEADGGYPPALYLEMGALGLFGMTTPEDLGGAGVDAVAYALALMEIAAGDGALSTIVSIQNSLIVSAIAIHGTDDQRKRFLPELISGRMIGAFALTEAGAGSDASAIQTRAMRIDGGWRLDGAKQFISSGSIAGLAIVYAVTDSSSGKNGITGFLIPTATPGYIVDKVEHKLGQAASDTCSIRLDGVVVEDRLRLGPEGKGYGLALSNLEAGRIGIAAQAVGMAQAALEIACRYAHERTTMGKPIIQHQAVAFWLADASARLEAARQLVLHAAARKDGGLPCLAEASMAKLVASETAEAVVSAALQTLGGYGYIEEFGIAKIYRDVRVCQIYEGTSDIQRMVIARSL